MIGGIGNMFVSVQFSECQSDEISNKYGVNVHHDSLKVARCPISALNVKVVRNSNRRG